MGSHTCIDSDKPAGKLQNQPPPVLQAGHSATVSSTDSAIPHFLPLPVGSSQFVLTFLTSLETSLALAKRLSRLRPSIIYQMSIHFPLQQDEVQEERQRVVFDIWIGKFQAFALPVTLALE